MSGVEVLRGDRRRQYELQGWHLGSVERGQSNHGIGNRDLRSGNSVGEGRAAASANNEVAMGRVFEDGIQRRLHAIYRAFVSGELDRPKSLARHVQDLY